MTMELVTGHAGTAHVSGADVGAFNAGTIGSGTYILASSLPVLSMLDANTLEVPVCEILAEGRHVRITAAENVTIESGSQTGYRNDIVYLRYNLDSGTGEETATLVVAKGTTVANQSDVVDPTTAYSSASILNGASTVDIALVRVSLAGLTPTPGWVVSARDSVTALVGDVAGLASALPYHVYTGEINKDFGSTSINICTIWSLSTFQTTFNTTEPWSCAVFFFNRNGSLSVGTMTAEYWASNFNPSGWRCRVQSNTTGTKSIGYLVLVPNSVSTI